MTELTRLTIRLALRACRREADPSVATRLLNLRLRADPIRAAGFGPRGSVRESFGIRRNPLVNKDRINISITIVMMIIIIIVIIIIIIIGSSS